MTIRRNTRRRDRVPPIPHPSWTYGSDRLAALSGKRLSARDFWERVGP
ncbi:hypothetical protein [Novosphingobium sp. Gsoil 351]|nr:hypothetical protein [Novosphingobium sp. Gsoil 351]QGN54548.1 hypothetical protein GKE62_08255 [Novosphingobium sp. Gsoil 351]